MIFSALLESATSGVHAINERIDKAWQRHRGAPLTHRARLTIALVLLVFCMFLASRFGLVDLIANGYRALAYLMLAVFVLPLATIGVARILKSRTSADTPGGDDAVSVALAHLDFSSARPAAAVGGAGRSAGGLRRARREPAHRRWAFPARRWRSSRTAAPPSRRASASGDLTAPGAVDADTIFATGSTGKAFTVAALAVLVDQGRIRWDDKVIDHMPDFRMYDPWVTREMTIRDLLVHRSGLGLGAGDLLFVPRSDLTRAETMRRLRYIRPATSFRSGYAYDNVLYMVAGQLIEEVSGQTWEQFVRENVLQADRHEPRDGRRCEPDRRSATAPARMPAWTARSAALGDQAPLDDASNISPNAAPAGGLAISANDMARWLAVQLGHGALPDGTAPVQRGAVARDVEPGGAPCRSRPLPEPLRAAQPMFSTYALGWSVAGLSRRQADLARRRRVRLARRGGAAPRPQCRHLHRRQCRGRPDGPRPDVRAARPLSRPAARHLAGEAAPRSGSSAPPPRSPRCRRRRRSPPGSARRCRSRAMPATMPIPGTARSTSASRTASSTSPSRTRRA